MGRCCTKLISVSQMDPCDDNTVMPVWYTLDGTFVFGTARTLRTRDG